LRCLSAWLPKTEEKTVWSDLTRIVPSLKTEKKELSEMNAPALLTMLSLFAPFAATAQSAAVYDNFAGASLDPSKWVGAPICSADSTLECMRVQRNGRLHLEAITYGLTGTNMGQVYDTSYINFANPLSLVSIGAQVAIPISNAVACASNPTPAHSQFLLSGSFFNTGTGNWTEDVQAAVIIEQFGGPTSNLSAAAFGSVGYGASFGNVSLGSVAPGETVRVTLRWDAPGSQFVVSLKHAAIPAIIATIPYSQANALPPAVPQRFLGVRNFVPNCTQTSTVAGMTAQVGRVLVNSPNTP
jgi:hypothetical protein